MSNKPTLDEILDGLSIDIEAVTHAPYTEENRPTTKVSVKGKVEAKQQLTQLIADIIGEDDDMTFKINPASDEDLVISLGENANNRLRAEQRQRAKDRGIDL